MAKTIIHIHKLANVRGHQKKASNNVFEQGVKYLNYSTESCSKKK